MSANTKKVYSGCVLCYHSCGIEVEVADGKVVSVKGQESHPLNKGYLCPKGRATIEHIYHPSRLRHPLKKDGTGFKQISWDQALDEIAAKLMDIKAKYGPEALGFFCGSVGVENFEMVALTHRFRAAYGSPNYFSVESICYRMRIRCRQITFGKYPVEETRFQPVHPLGAQSQRVRLPPAPGHYEKSAPGFENRGHRPQAHQTGRQGRDVSEDPPRNGRCPGPGHDACHH